MINVRQKYLGSVDKVSFMDRLYLPAIFKGMWITLKHFLFSKSVTTQYPEEKRAIAPRYRGRHVLKRDEEGRVRCTACYCCAFICPASCIRIVAGDATPDLKDQYREEKYPVVFEIDLFRCIYCGYCQEACPKAAIFLEGIYELATDSRDKFIIGKDILVDKQGGPRKIRQ
ncbi:MAG: NADH-quinone oxidoreductase subunit I [Spirochaetia bacterium]|nr:NADH-quinone oxidoreductase subunit I [Spirochaetia bacterium]